MRRSSTFPPVFVLNVYYSGMGIARNLHGLGIPVYGLSSEADAPGMTSRFFEKIYKVPNGRDEPNALRHKLLEICKEHDEAPVIFPTRDFDVLFLNEYRNELGGFYRLPENEAVNSHTRQTRTGQYCRKAGHLGSGYRNLPHRCRD